MSISTPVITNIYTRSVRLQYPTGFPEGVSWLWFVRSHVSTGYTWPSDSNPSAAIAAAVTLGEGGNGVIRDPGDMGEGWDNYGGGGIAQLKEQGGENACIYLNDGPAFGNPDYRYRWQSPDGTYASDYIVLPAAPDLNIYNSSYLYKKRARIKRGTSGVVELSEQRYYDTTPPYDWRVTSSVEEATSNSPGDWDVSFNDASGMFSVTVPENAYKKDYALEAYSMSAHGHYHRTLGLFYVPCVDVTITKTELP